MARKENGRPRGLQRRGKNDPSQSDSAILRADLRTRFAVDGVDIRYVTLRSLRGQIAMVTQENILFHDTVLEQYLLRHE